MKIKFEWKRIGDMTYRAKVIGGWIVEHIDCDRPTLVFIPDSNHEWEIEQC